VSLRRLEEKDGDFVVLEGCIVCSTPLGGVEKALPPLVCLLLQLHPADPLYFSPTASEAFLTM